MTESTSRPIIGAEGLSAPPALAQQVSAVEKKSDAAIDALRRETMMAIEALHAEQQIEVARLEALIQTAREINAADVARIQEVKNLHWLEHKGTHEQNDEAVRVAVAALDKRLDGLNELRQMVTDRDKFFASLVSVEETNKRLDRGEIDSRARFEAVDRRINEMATALSKEARAEGRPGQDLKTSSGTLIAAIFVAVAIISIIVALMNFVTSR